MKKNLKNLPKLFRPNSNFLILHPFAEVDKVLLMLNFYSNKRKMLSLLMHSRNSMTLSKSKVRSLRKTVVRWLMFSEKKENRPKKLLLKNKYLKLNLPRSVAVVFKPIVIY